MLKKYGDIVAGTVFLIITALYWQGTFLHLKFKLSKYGAEFVPRIYCIVMAAVAIALIVRGIFVLRRSGAGESTATGRISMRAAGTVLLIAAYIYLLPSVGFTLSTFGYLIAQVLMLAPRGMVGIVPVVVFSAVTAGSLNYLFLRVFHLVLPSGVFGI